MRKTIYFLLIYLQFITLSFGQDSLERIIQSKSIDYILSGKQDSADIYSDSLISLLLVQSDSSAIVEWLNLKANKEIYYGNVEGAYMDVSRSLRIARELKDNELLVNSLFLQGLIYRFKEQPRKAMEYLDEVRRLAKLMKDDKTLVRVYSRYSDLYGESLNNNMRDRYIDSALQLCLTNNYDYQLATIYGKMGREWARNAKTAREGINYTRKELSILEDLKDSSDFHSSFQSLGLAYLNLKLYDSARYYFNRSLELKLKVNNFQGAAFAYSKLGKTYEGLKNIDKAKENYHKALEIALKINRPRSMTVASRLHIIYKQEKNYKKALEMLEIYKKSSDQLKNEVFKRNAIQQEYEIEYAQKAFEDSLAQKQLNFELELAHQNEITKKNKAINYSIIAIALFMILAFGAWRRSAFIKKANKILAIEKQRAEEGEAFKQTFLANMSHEIRTPMNAVLGLTNLTLDTKLNEKQKAYLEAIKQSSENLLIVINDILDISKLEAGGLILEDVPFQLEEVLEQVRNTLQFKANEKNINFNIESSISPEAYLKGDPHRLWQVLVNLCSNAIKFTEEGSVDLKVKQHQDKVKFLVKDTGIGIPKDKQEKLFESFQQADLSTTRKYGGTGLGLSIAKNFVELMGGQIKLESQEGIGSEFSFLVNLPEADKESVNQFIQTKQVDYNNFKGMSILLAEDNEFNQIVVVDTLLNLVEDVQIDVANNGEEAVEKFKNGRYNLILMDSNMPVMDGREATRQIRSLEKGEDSTPIIALTASVLATEIDRCIEAGMNDSIPKPFKREEFFTTIGKYYKVKG